MVELLGVLLALVLFGLGVLIWRLLRWARRGLGLLFGAARPDHRLASLRGVRLRAARALSRQQAARIAALMEELARTRRALHLAEAARACPGLPDDRFRRAKQAFAVHFHPDRLRCAEPERGIRVRIFQQFWQVLRRIERG
ncbi:hypothetical protein [Roseicella aerolata]|uniref:J domain-containing protein n=1 Tax=Roseicella aerolata TaxID=2883479 RepID=A0A9X1L9H1_9PROT|nr:hypothetical protein [Roseicella aerolata]MCB4823689.1 hypothetical protein [Roseicella aerolata]